MKKKDEVIVFEKRPWEEEHPCWDCETGRPVSELSDEFSEITGKLLDALELLEEAARRCEELENLYDEHGPKVCKECAECRKYANWKVEMKYWEDRKMKVRMGTWRTEDDEGSEKRVDGEADEERDKETDAED